MSDTRPVAYQPCPTCGEPVPDDITKCPNCLFDLRGPAAAPTATAEARPAARRGAWTKPLMWIAQTALGALIIWGADVLFFSRDTRDVRAGKAVLEKYLQAPGSAKHIKSETVLSEGDHRIVYFVVDSQNAFGAMLRNTYCVAFQIDDKEFHWKGVDAVGECTDPPSKEMLSIIQSLNWPAAQ